MDAVERLVPRSVSTALPNLLALGVYGFALSLLVNRGTYKPALYVCALGIAGLWGAGGFKLPLGRPVLVMLGFGLVFLLQGWGMADRPIAGHFHLVLAWSMVAATAVTLLPDRVGRSWSHRSATAALLVLFVLVQTVAYELVTKKDWAGLFPNIHYLALYSVITLPILYCFALQAKSALRWVLVLAVVGDFLLLMKTHSRPGYLALLAAALATVPFLAPRVRAWVLATIIFVPTVLYYSGMFGFAARIDDLLAHFAEEERLTLWRETWGLQLQSTGPEWWLGHGLGQFYEDYLVVPKYHWWNDYYASPHNYVLELLYSHGWSGLALFLIAYGLLYTRLSAAVLADADRVRRRVGIALISSTTAQLVIGFLTLPFFSRHNLYPFSLILGSGLRYIMDVRRNG
jgi:hypothetical protein